MRFQRLEIVLLVSLAACGGGDPVATMQSNVVTINIFDFYYSPVSNTVRVGTRVEWVNHGPSPHTTTSDVGAWDSGIPEPASPGRWRHATAPDDPSAESLWHGGGRRCLLVHLQHCRRVRLPLFAPPTSHQPGVCGHDNRHRVACAGAGRQRSAPAPPPLPAGAAVPSSGRVPRSAPGASPFDDASLVQHDDLVGIAHGGQPVRDDDRRTSLEALRRARRIFASVCASTALSASSSRKRHLRSEVMWCLAAAIERLDSPPARSY